MKYLAFITFLGLLLPEIALSQIIDRKVTIQVTNTTVETVLEQLSNSYDISFSYCKDYMVFDESVTLNRTDTPIGSILEEILGHRIDYREIGNLIVFKKVEATTVTVEEVAKPIVKPVSSQPRKVVQEKVTREFPEQLKPLNGVMDFQWTVLDDSSKIISTDQPTKSQRVSSNISVVKKAPVAYAARNNEMDFRMPKRTVQQAFENIESNFLMKPHVFRGFYKEMYEENEKTISVVDAAVEIYDKGYNGVNGKKPREKVALRSVRASRSYMQDVFKKDFEHFNSLSAMLRWNRVKYRNTDIESHMGKKPYRLDSTIRSTTGVTYVVSTTQSSRRAESKITYYIDAMTHAFQKVEYWDMANEGFYLDQKWQFSDDPTYHFRAKKALIVYEFESYDGKMYLSRCSERSYADIYNSKKKSVEWELGCSRTLIITDVENGNKKSKNVKVMDVNKGLVLQTTEYDSVLWDKYEKQNLMPLVQAELEHLEAELSLEEQYQENAIVSKR